MAHRNTGGHDLSGLSAGLAQPAPHSVPNENGRRICVFCGSSLGLNPAYADAARRLGRAIGENGCTLVFGGGAVGMMGEVARAAREAGTSAPVNAALTRILSDIAHLPQLWAKYRERPSTLADEVTAERG